MVTRWNQNIVIVENKHRCEVSVFYLRLQYMLQWKACLSLSYFLQKFWYWTGGKKYQVKKGEFSKLLFSKTNHVISWQLIPFNSPDSSEQHTPGKQKKGFIAKHAFPKWRTLNMVESSNGELRQRIVSYLTQGRLSHGIKHTSHSYDGAHGRA